MTRHLLFLFTLASVLVSCKEEKKDIYGTFRVDIITTLIENKEVRLVRDDNTRLEPNVAIPVSEYTHNGRAYIYYIQENPTASQIKIRSISPVITYPLEVSPFKYIEKPIHLVSLWSGSHYVNLRYKVPMNNHPFHLALYKTAAKNELPNDTLFLTLKYSENDTPAYLKETFCCFNIESALKSRHSTLCIEAPNSTQYQQQFIIPLANK